LKIEKGNPDEIVFENYCSFAILQISILLLVGATPGKYDIASTIDCI
jgi:hypothetical protein